MANISPGVYSKITDLSTYVQAVPSTIGMIAALTTKGEDNVLRFIGSRAELISEFGEPNINEFGKAYGQGMYCAYNYLGESGALYFIRPMPDDASFANLRIEASRGATDATASIQVTYVASTSANTLNELKTKLSQETDVYPICVLRPIGRGEDYNALAVRFTAHSNPLKNDVFVMDIYEKQSDDSVVIIESFEVSFDPSAIDSNGDSLWISYILQTYSTVLRAEMLKVDETTYAAGYDLVVRTYDKEIGTVSVDLVTASITDNKQDFSDWETSSPTYTYCIIATDARGNKLYGWLGAASGDDNETVAIYNGRLSGASQGWIGDTSSFDDSSVITYKIKKSYDEISDAFTSSEPVPLKKGTDGTLRTATGDLDTTVAKQLLSQAYAGTLTSKVDGSTAIDDVLDTENIYFSVVFDCGYHADIKDQISTLVQTRKDCVAILDNGDNASYTAALTSRLNTNTFNNYLTSLYEPYNKVSDQFTGGDIWVSPVYHMSYLVPRNDNVANVWWAVAGFDRASIDTIKELRYNARQGQRDQFYLKQINPIVQFNEGYAPWGQLTSQAKASALQDLNIVRLVLYVQRALSRFARGFIFQQNDQTTWDLVAGKIVPFLEDIKNSRGMYSYSVEVSATDYEKKIKTFHINVTLEPVRTVEKVELNFFIE